VQRRDISQSPGGAAYVDQRLFYVDAFGANGDFMIRDHLCSFAESRVPLTLEPISPKAFLLKIADKTQI
jgi:hypothetical protein